MKNLVSNMVIGLFLAVLTACQISSDSLDENKEPVDIDRVSEMLLLAEADQCNTTSQCQETYGESATDCANSQSSQSICMCGEERCDAPPPFTPIPPTGDECNRTSECQDIYGPQADDCANSQSSESICYCGGVACYEIDPGDGNPSDPDPGNGNDGNDSVEDATECVVIDATAFDKYTGIPGFTDATVDAKLGVSVLQIASRGAWAAAQETYTGNNLDVIFRLNAMQEIDGEPSYKLKVNGNELGRVKNTRIFGTSTPEYSLEQHMLSSDYFALKKNDLIQIEFQNHTNGLVPEGDTTATARGRWASIEICSVPSDGGDSGSDSIPAGYTYIADEGDTINISSALDLAYGADGEFAFLPNQSSNITCSNETFGDPIPGTVKKCYAKPAVGPTEPGEGKCEIGGELTKFGRTELVCQGLSADENDPNTFTDYRFNVTFSKGSQSFVIPGHFAADGQAANTSATSGDRWRAYFTPPTTGAWTYNVSFRKGNDIAVSTGTNAGTAVVPFNGMSGTFNIGSIAATLPDMRARGYLQHVEGERYLRFSHDKTLFVEAGMDSPENIFGYSEFDNTVKYSNVGSCKGILHDFEPHSDDWNAGDPTWKNGKGKSLIGLINYIAGRGVNAIYMMGMTVNSDGCDAHPWTIYNNNGTEKAFDVSKLDQWEIAFRHMENKGLLIHYMTQETENDQLLNNGNLGLERKLYYREIISRFGHHPALQWNLGEENTNTPAQQKAFSNYIRSLDAYNKPIFMHTFPGETDRYDDLLGHSTFDGPTIQIGNIPESSDGNSVYGKAKTWLDKSEAAGKQWVVTFTEASGAQAPRPYESVTKRQRVYWMWASVMSGGAGFEWYLKGPASGSGSVHAYDLAVENLREFDNYWQQTGHFAHFFEDIMQREKGIDLNDLSSRNGLTSTNSDWVLANPGEAYLILLRNGGTTNLNLPDSNIYEVLWFNPRTGAQHLGDEIQGAGNRPIGNAPNQLTQDWVVLVTRKADQPDNGGSSSAYNEAGGLVVMEAEYTHSNLDLWEELTSVNTFTGDGYLQFNGNTVINGPADSPLEYQFKINKGGVYHLHMRVARETVDGRTDVANDGYVRVEGNYTSPVRTALNTLKTDTKFYGGGHNQFLWASGDRLDRFDEKWPAVYEFKAGETYTLVLSGRSKLFKVDRIVFRHADVAVNVAQNLSTAETK